MDVEAVWYSPDLRDYKRIEMILFCSLENSSEGSFWRDFQHILSHWNILEQICGLKVWLFWEKKIKKMVYLSLGLLGALTFSNRKFPSPGCWIYHLEDRRILCLLDCPSHTPGDLAFEETVEACQSCSSQERKNILRRSVFLNSLIFSIKSNILIPISISSFTTLWLLGNLLKCPWLYFLHL